MNTPENVLEQPLCFPPTPTGRAVSEALRKFCTAPSVSNKVAVVTALQEYFACVERAARDDVGIT